MTVECLKVVSFDAVDWRKIDIYVFRFIETSLEFLGINV
jgi:hypothetical protein